MNMATMQEISTPAGIRSRGGGSPTMMLNIRQEVSQHPLRGVEKNSKFWDDATEFSLQKRDANMGT